MTDDTKELIQFQLSMLRQTMKNEGVIFALAVDKQDFDKSRLFFMDNQQLYDATIARLRIKADLCIYQEAKMKGQMNLFPEEYIKDSDCTKDTPVVHRKPDTPIYWTGVRIKSRVQGRFMEQRVVHAKGGIDR